MKSKACLLTHSVLMASILFNIARIGNSQLKCNYLKNEKIILNFLFNFGKLNQFLNICKKKMLVVANMFPKLQTVKNFVTPLCKKRRFRTRLDSQHAEVSRILAKSHESAFIMFFHQFDRT